MKKEEKRLIINNRRSKLIRRKLIKCETVGSCVIIVIAKAADDETGKQLADA